MTDNLESKPWWNYLDIDLKELFKESYLLFAMFAKRYNDTPKLEGEFSDYSFIVFPAAKAYEGFLKKVFLELGFITNDTYFGKHFRIGRALNPALESFLREKESVYDRIVTLCGGANLADKLWETWKLSRNQTFHFFPGEANKVNFKVAGERLELIIDAIDATFEGCKLGKQQ